MSHSDGPLRVDEVSLDLSTAEPSPERPAPARVLLPEPMLRYRCNLQGCCCSGWRIGFRASDLVKLGRRLSPDDRDKLTRDVEFRVATDREGDRVVEEFFLADEDRLCRFLTPDRKTCGLHADYGLDALPELCVDFPVATFTEGEGVSFYFDPVCPSVLDQLSESDAPLTTAVVEAPYADRGFDLRARHTKGVVALRAADRLLPPSVIERVRGKVLDALADRSRPVWEHLRALELAYGALARGTDPEDFAIEYGGAPGPFLRHLGRCLGAHGHRALEESLRSYRRFVFSMPVDDASFAWEELGDLLQRWGEAWDPYLGPSEDALRPLHLRYLALCHVTPYAAPDGDLARFAGAITHRFATALRYAAVMGAALRRPVDVGIMKAALGASEYFYRSRTIPPDLMPWFDPDDGVEST